MSLSRSPSPVPGGGWSSPALNVHSGGSSPSASPGHWQSFRARNLGVNGYPSFSTHNQGFFTRHMRHISNSLPRFRSGSHSPSSEKAKFALGQWPGQNMPLVRRLRSVVGRMGRKLKLRLLMGFIMLLCVYIFYHSRK